MNILIADDDPISRDLLSRILRREPGLAVTEAESGDRALAVLRADPARFDLAILDIMMPGRNGLDVLEALRSEDGPLATLPVILCSALNDRATVEQAARLKATFYIAKPYARSAVIAKVNQVRESLARRARDDGSVALAQRLGIPEGEAQEMLDRFQGEFGEWLGALETGDPSPEVLQEEISRWHSAATNLGLLTAAADLQAAAVELKWAVDAAAKGLLIERPARCVLDYFRRAARSSDATAQLPG